MKKLKDEREDNIITEQAAANKKHGRKEKLLEGYDAFPRHKGQGPQKPRFDRK